jgi:hypothetical protein
MHAKGCKEESRKWKDQSLIFYPLISYTLTPRLFWARHNVLFLDPAVFIACSYPVSQWNPMKKLS